MSKSKGWTVKIESANDLKRWYHLNDWQAQRIWDYIKSIPKRTNFLDMDLDAWLRAEEARLAIEVGSVHPDHQALSFGALKSGNK
jgi:hypothetical protein